MVFVLCNISKAELLTKGQFNLPQSLVKRPKPGCEEAEISFNCFHLETFITGFLITDYRHRIFSGIASFEEQSIHMAQHSLFWAEGVDKQGRNASGSLNHSASWLMLSLISFTFL